MIRGQKRALDKQPSVNVNLNASIHNRFDIEVIDARTGEVKQRAQAENVICNQMWSKLFSTSVWNYCIHIGSGSGTPSDSDTQLFSYIASKTSQVESYSNEPGVFSLTKKIQLSESEYVGVTLTEVGIASGSTKTTLCTHAMLADMNGNQISIIKTDTDIINIYATVFVHYNVDGYNGVMVFGNTQTLSQDKSYLYGFLPYLAYGYEPGANNYGAATPPKKYLAGAGTMQYYNSDPSKKRGISWETSITTTYDADNKKLICTANRIAASSGNDYKNAYNIIVFTDNSSNYYYAIFKIPVSVLFPSGVAVTGDAIGTGDGETTDFTSTFPGISECTVYVDGVAADVAIDDHTPFIISNLKNGYLLEYFKKASDGNYYPAFMPISGTITIHSGEEVVFRNPFYNRLGIATVKGVSLAEFYVSDDCINWTHLSKNSNSDVVEVPEQYRKSQWIRFANSQDGNVSVWTFQGDDYGIIMDKASNANIHFATAPAAGSVITADYKTDVIPKDENHVFDFSLTIQLGEYTE